MPDADARADIGRVCLVAVCFTLFCHRGTEGTEEQVFIRALRWPEACATHGDMGPVFPDLEDDRWAN